MTENITPDESARKGEWDGVVDDLMKKAGSDVTAAINRTVAISPERLPVAIAAGAAAIGVIAAILTEMAGDYDAEKPHPDNVLLAALLCARIGTRERDGISLAYDDFAKLKEQP